MSRYCNQFRSLVILREKCVWRELQIYPRELVINSTPNFSRWYCQECTKTMPYDYANDNARAPRPF